MSFDAFCYFPKSDVKGETQDDFYSGKDAFEILEFGIGARNNINIGSISGGGGAGKAEFNQLTMKKKTDLGSCKLFSNLCEGKHFPEMVIELRRSGGEATKSGAVFLKFEFLFVMIEEIGWSGADGDDICEEELTIEYGAMKVTYNLQDKEGKMKKGDDAKWSRVKNKADYIV